VSTTLKRLGTTGILLHLLFKNTTCSDLFGLQNVLVWLLAATYLLTKIAVPSSRPTENCFAQLNQTTISHCIALCIPVVTHRSSYSCWGSFVFLGTLLDKAFPHYSVKVHRRVSSELVFLYLQCTVWRCTESMTSNCSMHHPLYRDLSNALVMKCECCRKIAMRARANFL